MRRIDRIRSMSVYEMADAIIEHRADEIPCPSKEECTDYYDAHGELPPGGCRECLIEFKGGKLMRVLEKILQEIEVAIYPAEGIGCGLEDVDITDRYEAAAYGWNEAVERISEIIRSHMEDELVSNSDKLDGDKKEYINIQDERLWDILFEEACVEGEQADRIQEKLLRICISHKLDDGWIPVEERLPENAKHKGAFCPKYSVMTKYGQTVGWFNPDLESWFVLFWFMTSRYAEEEIDFYRGDVPKGVRVPKGTGIVIAWRPLPAPYQPKEEK